MKIKKITKKEESALVYDIGVEDTHSYVLENGLLSHNSYVPTNEISGGCLVEGTKIKLSDCSLKNINDIEVGDNVLTLEGNEYVTKLFEFDKETIEVEFEDGYTVECSEDHRFLIKYKEWVKAKDLTTDMYSVKDTGNEYIKIKNINRTNETKKVYDITVENHHNYVLENGVVTHNSGLKYAASTIVSLGKKKDKDGNDVVGNIIRATTYKSRYSKEQKRVELRLNFTTGLNKYYGLLELAEKYDIIKKTGTRYELPDGSKVFGKKINEDPEKYFTPDIMEKLEEVCKQEFHLGDGEDSYDVEEEIDNIEEGINEHNPVEDNTTESNTQ